MHSQWISLLNTEQLNEIDKLSHQKPVALFKHSTRCGISSMAEHSLKEGWNWTTDDLSFYHLDLIKHRDVSNAIAEHYGVHHQSPQLIWVRGGKAQEVRTHHAISAALIEDWLAKSPE